MILKETGHSFKELSENIVVSKGGVQREFMRGVPHYCPIKGTVRSRTGDLIRWDIKSKTTRSLSS
jgi:hypothetical protein